MKKVLYSIMTVVAVAFMVSCSPTVDDVFDSSSTERAEKQMAKNLEVLTSAPNGWRMEYYGDTSYGGYNVFLKFNEDNSVTVASEKVGGSHKGGVDAEGKLNRFTSGFRMEQSMGIVLTFCEYNDIFHYFSEPSNDDYGYPGEGFDGDFEFRMMECTPDSVVLSGRKHNNRIVMYPISADQTWEQVHQQILDTEKYMASRSYSLWVDDEDQDMYIYQSYRRLVFQYKDEQGTLTAKSVPYIVTADGYKFYRNIEVRGIKIESIAKGETDQYFCATNNKDIQLWAYVPTLTENLRSSMWFIDYKNLGEYAQPYWDKFAEAIKKAGPNKTEATCYYAFLGFYENKIGLNLMVGNDAPRFGLSITSLNEDGSECLIKPNTGDNNNTGKTYYKSFKLNEALIPFIGEKATGLEFTLSTDYQRNPSYITLTDKKNPKNVIKLVAEEIRLPFKSKEE